VDTLVHVVTRAPVPWFLLGAYLCGSIPFGLVLALVFAKKDVRTAGSGNIGATNVARVVGKKLGIVTLVLDAAKGALAVYLAGHVLPVPADLEPHRFLIEGLAGLFALVGHCFPVWLLFRGGKGVATGLGVLLVHRPEVAAVGLVAFAVTYAFARLVSVGSIVAAIAVVVALFVRGPLDVTLLPFSVCAAIILVKHQGNIRRVLKKTELKL
jgi:glycerol-3-phosphate acyltransferase PlsY